MAGTFPDDKPIVRRAVVRLAPEMHRWIAEVLDYVELRESWIDPDMFRIDLKTVERLRTVFGIRSDTPPPQVSVTHDDIFALEIFTDAADAYSHRKGEAGLLDVTDDQLTELHQWLARTVRHFITPLRPDD